MVIRLVGWIQDFGQMTCRISDTNCNSTYYPLLATHIAWQILMWPCYMSFVISICIVDSNGMHPAILQYCTIPSEIHRSEHIPYLRRWLICNAFLQDLWKDGFTTIRTFLFFLCLIFLLWKHYKHWKGKIAYSGKQSLMVKHFRSDLITTDIL